MSFDLIKNIDNNIFSENNDKIIHAVDNTINYCKVLLLEIKSPKATHNFIKKIIIEHMYVIYYCFKYIGLLHIIKNTNTIFLDKLDEKIDNYLKLFYSNKEYNKIISNIKTDNNDEKYFFDYIIQQFNKYKKLDNTQKELIYEINKILSQNYSVSIDKQKIILNRDNFYNLQKKYKDPVIRHKIESLYFQKSDKCMPLLEKLIVQRHNYANSLNYKTFFDYNKQKNNEESIEIKTLINDLIMKIDNRSKKETQRIYKNLKKDGYKKNVETSDIIYYYEQMKSQYTFSLEHVLKVTFELIKTYFNLSCVKIEYNNKLWNNNIQTYAVFNDKQQLGIIHFDLIINSDKNITTPICIHMNHKYCDNNNTKYLTRIGIIGGYLNYDTKCIKHSDIIALFKEIGIAIQYLLYDTETGNMYYKDEFFLLTSKIMEYIAWEKSTIQLLCNDEKIIEHILFARYIDFANSIKLRCINAFFDHIIHNSIDFINTIKKNDKYDGSIIKNLYKQIYHDIMLSQKDTFEIYPQGIHPIVVLQEINGSETSIYENILIEILSYNIFSLIKKNQENKQKYIKILSQANSNKFKDILNKFISKIGDNYCFYLQELIGYDEIDTEINMKIKKNQNNSKHLSDNNIIIDRKLTH